MQHKVSKIKVYETTDYKRFRFIKGNRETNKHKQEKIIAEIKAGNDILDESPILVTESGNFLDVKDGQNRFEIAMELKRPVHYILKKDKMSLYNLAKNNSNVEKWTSENFINCYKASGNENYIQLDKFHKKYKISIGVCLTMLNTASGISGGNEGLTAKFQQGQYEVKKWKEAVQLAELCKNFSAFPAWNSRGFITAITKILEAGLCDFDQLKKKFDRDPKKLTLQSNWKGYVNNLEIIYNYDNSKRRVII